MFTKNKREDNKSRQIDFQALNFTLSGNAVFRLLILDILNSPHHVVFIFIH